MPAPNLATAPVSVVIPCLDAAAHLAACLDAVDLGCRSGLVREVILVDGGSSDRSRDIARERGLRVITTRRGRGGQLAEGAASAAGDWLLFLHADTVLAPGWNQEAAAFVAAAGNADRAGFFRFALDDPRPLARRLEKLVAWRCRLLLLPYGDQGLLIGRGFYESVGGFDGLPLMEDVDLVRRIGGHRLTPLRSAAVTSAERFRRAGYVRRSLRNLGCLALYFAGVDPQRLVRLYR